MTSTEERLLRAYLSAHGGIYGQDDDIGFGVWYAGRATPEGEVDYKHVLELAQVWQGRYVEGTARATIPATLSCWIPWAMRRSRFRTSTWRTAPALDAGRLLVLVSRLGVAAMRTHYHVEQDGHLIGGRQPRRRPAWTMAIRLSKERPEDRCVLCPAMGISVGSPGCRTSVGRSAGPKNVGVEWCHFSFPINIYTRVRC